MPGPTAKAFRTHDHGRCRAAAMAEARRAARERGLRLTPIRARVLEILLEAHAALGAYEVLDRLAAEGAPRQPPLAYRALEFLVAQGYAHRIERLNAFVACDRPGAAHDAAFMICRGCGAVAEIEAGAVTRGLDGAATELGFAIRSAMVEVEGACPDCAASR